MKHQIPPGHGYWVMLSRMSGSCGLISPTVFLRMKRAEDNVILLLEETALVISNVIGCGEPMASLWVLSSIPASGIVYHVYVRQLFLST